MHLSRTSLKMSRFLYPVRRINIVFFNICIFLPVKSNVFIDTRSSKSRFLGPLKIIKYYNKKNDLNIYFNHPTGLHFLRFTFKITHLDYILYVASKIAFLGQFSAFRVFRTEVPFEWTFTSGNFFVSCDVITQKSRVRAIDDARVAGVTFSLCSCHDNSTVFREKLSVLTAELTRSSLSNLRETLQLIWSSGCNSASKSRVRSWPWNSRQFFKTCCSLVHLSGCLYCHRRHRWKEKHV